MLQFLGLDPTSEAVYRLMLVHHDWRAADIAGYIGAPEAEVRTALQRLIALRLLRWSLNDPKQLLPVTPTLGFQALLQHQQAEILQKQEEFLEAQAEVTRLTAEYSTLCCTSSHNELEHILGLDAIHTVVEALAERSITECLSFMPGGAQSLESLDASRPLDESMLKRGVKVLTLYHGSAWNDGATLNYARWLVSMGGEVRTVPSLPLRLVIFDREIAVVPVDPEAAHQGAMQISSPGVITAMVALFERVWDAGVPLGHVVRRDENGVTAQERELLQLLSYGLTDEVVGKRLGLGLRTVRRMVADISDRLDARSRFEIGAKACQRGWLKA